MIINNIINPILINEYKLVNEPLLFHCSISIHSQILDNGNEEITIFENNQMIFNENQSKERDDDIYFSILKKGDQLEDFIKIAEKLSEINLLEGRQIC